MELFKLKTILARAQKYSNLWNNNDFIEWKTEIVDKRLENYRNAVLEGDPDSEDTKKAHIRYQELKFICEDIFKWQKAAEDKANKEINNLGE